MNFAPAVVEKFLMARLKDVAVLQGAYIGPIPALASESKYVVWGLYRSKVSEDAFADRIYSEIQYRVVAGVKSTVLSDELEEMAKAIDVALQQAHGQTSSGFNLLSKQVLSICGQSFDAKAPTMFYEAGGIYSFLVDA